MFTDSCARAGSFTPLREGPGGPQEFQRSVGTATNRFCAPRRRGIPQDSEIIYGGRLVLRSLGRQRWRPIFLLVAGEIWENWGWSLTRTGQDARASIAKSNGTFGLINGTGAWIIELWVIVWNTKHPKGAPGMELWGRGNGTSVAL